MILTNEIYYEIIKKIHAEKFDSRKLEDLLSSQYGIPKNTVLSIIANEYKKKMKKTQYKMTKIASMQLDGYVALKNEIKHDGVMLKIGDKFGIPYTLLAKILLEKFYQEEDSNSKKNKSANVKQFLKDSTLIEDPDLAYEIYLCQTYDTQYGNINDVIRHSLGQEYEYHLQKVLKDRGITFQSEDDLRIYGYDKTPDIKLHTPFAVNGFIVNWIESKALFADPEEHQAYVKDQYLSYWNRFGTGLVIYWLGMVDTVNDPTEKKFIVRNDFPQKITLMDPLLFVKIPQRLSLESGDKKDETCNQK